MRRVLLLWPLLCLAGLGGAARAAGFSLAPTVLEIDPDRRMTVETRLTNIENAPLTFTVEVMRWENVNGQDVYTPTRDVLVNPARFTLAPLGKQVIRVGLQKRVGAAELTYRVFLRQQPSGAGAAPQPAAPSSTPADGSAANIQTLLNISLPVYAAPASAAPKLVYTPAVKGTDLELGIQNAGNRHFTFRQLSIVSDTGQTFTLASKAVLPGSAVTLRLPGFAGAKLLRMTTYDPQGKELYDELRLP